jgi:hypothetical protein
VFLENSALRETYDMAAITPYLFGKGGNLEFCSKHEQMAGKIIINSEIKERRIRLG